MKPSLVPRLICLTCGSPLELKSFAREGAEVIEGVLRCRTGDATYPVTRGVPRFVADNAYAGTFGRQWNWFRKTQIDSLNGSDESRRSFIETTGWSSQELAGRLVLDAGVGAGRYAEVAANMGAEVVGVDLTTAVDAAYENIGRRPGVHLLQADIFALPFRPETFAYAYSIGVLHHTPNPRLAFERVARLVRPDGGLAVYLYSAYGPGFRGSDFLRRVSTRLPTSLMLGLTTAAIPLYYVYRVPVVGKLLQLACPISQQRHWKWRWLDTFDWYTPRYQWKVLYPDVYRWFRACGFHEVEILDGPVRLSGTKDARRLGPDLLPVEAAQSAS